MFLNKEQPTNPVNKPISIKITVTTGKITHEVIFYVKYTKYLNVKENFLGKVKI